MIDAQALMYAGITPPPPGSNRTTCPICSHHRVKDWERCMVIRPMGDVMEVYCHHCGYEQEVQV